jgi:hypothetical protein
MKSLIKLSLVVSILGICQSALAVAPVPSQPVNVIKATVTNLFDEREKPYTCSLIGEHWWNDLSIQTAASNLDRAAKLAVTPFMTIQDDYSRETNAIRIEYKGKFYYIQHVECTPTQSI